MKIAFYTLGCKVNQYETNGMIQKFMEKGYEIVPSNEYADIYIINTCTVTNMSDKKSRQMIRKVKEQNMYSIVVAVGCYVDVSREKLEELKEIDLLVNNKEKKDIVEIVEKYLSNKRKRKIKSEKENMQYPEFGVITYTDKTRAVIKIQDGCDRFCSYCIIPYARGRVCSRDPRNILEEINKIVKKGIQEIVLTGIHIASYGKDFEKDYFLIDLLEEINKIEGIKRIRLGSLEPTIMTDEFIIRLSNLEKVCHHFHLSLQSGCDDVLKRMNRKYTTREFELIVNKIRSIYQDVILTTDIIVGFPGESEEEFETTYEFLKKIKFYKMHVFPYSPREGTVASKMSSQILKSIKDVRSKKLIELSNKNTKYYMDKYIDETVEILIEEKDEKGNYKGHTANYILASIESDKPNLENKIVSVDIYEKNNEEYLLGKL